MDKVETVFYSEQYGVSFKQLNIGDIFVTATGNWMVYDKGTKTLVAYKIENGIIKEDSEIVFFNYEFSDIGG